MGTENSQRTLLSSWKEIASYLNCSVRTCRRWEKEYGLPVHRIEGADKSPVYAYKEELDAWLKKKLNNHNYLKKRYQLPVNILRKGCIVVLPLCAIVLGYFLFSNSSKLPAQVQWNEANIVVSDLSAEKLMVWSFDGQEAFTLTLTAEPTRFSKVAMDDVDNDGTPEIVALMNISVKKKKGDGNEVKEGSDESEDQKPEGRIYPVILKKGKTYDWQRLAESIFKSDMDYFISSYGGVLSLTIGDVDGIPGKEIIITSYDEIAVFRYEKKTDQLRLVAARSELIEGIRLNLWSTAIDSSSESGKSLIFVSAFQVGRAERSFLLILEMVNDWPVVRKAVPSDTYTASNPLCIGDVIEGGDREIITARTRRRGDWDNAYILGWDQKGDKLFDFQLYEPQLTRASFRPIPRIAVGDLTPHPGDEIVIITNLRNQPCELIVYRIKDLCLTEVSRHRFDFPGNRIRQVCIANLDEDAANEIFILGVRYNENDEFQHLFLEFFDYNTDLTSVWREEILSKNVRHVSVRGMNSN